MTNSEKGKQRRTKVLVAAAGAAIVFATFVVKDNWRDDAKSLEDAIDNAENAFVIRTENARNFDELRRFEKEFREFRRNPTLPTDPFTSGGDLGLPEYAPEDVENADITLDNIDRLLRRLPGVSESLQKLAVIREDIAHFREQWTLYKRAPNPDTEQTLMTLFDGISVHTTSLAREALSTADKKLVANEVTFHRLNWISYCLYLLGALIAICGALIGVDVEG